MRSVLIAIIMLATLFYFVREREARAEFTGDLYALCNPAFTPNCNDRALMIKDVCEESIEVFGGYETDYNIPNDYYCERVDAATRDAYFDTLEPDVREKTFRAWREGR